MKQLSNSAEIAVVEVVHSRVRSIPEWGAALADYAVRMNSGFFAAEFMDIVLQSPGGIYDLYDAFCFAQIHALLHEGRILCCQVGVGDRPLADSQRQEMNVLLSDLPEPFHATFSGGTNDSDGKFGWDAEITFCHRGGDRERWRGASGPGHVPLEIGYTSGAVTWMHLKLEGGVARWPYGQNCITVLYMR